MTVGKINLSNINAFVNCTFLANMERSNLYLKLFKLVFGSVSLFASENEQMLKVRGTLWSHIHVTKTLFSWVHVHELLNNVTITLISNCFGYHEE